MTEKFIVVREPDDDRDCPRRWVKADVDRDLLARNREALRAILAREKAE